MATRTITIGVPDFTLDADGTLAANADDRVATQKATKTYVDAHAGGGGGGYQYVDGIVDAVTWTPATLTALGAPGLSNANPADLGTAAPGVATEASRADHVHDMPSAADVGAAATSHVHSGADITSGTVGTARLGSGGDGSGNHILFDNGTWGDPVGAVIAETILSSPSATRCDDGTGG